MWREVILGGAPDQGSFANARIAKKDYLKQVVVPKIHVLWKVTAIKLKFTLLYESKDYVGLIDTVVMSPTCNVETERFLHADSAAK